MPEINKTLSKFLRAVDLLEIHNMLIDKSPAHLCFPLTLPPIMSNETAYASHHQLSPFPYVFQLDQLSSPLLQAVNCFIPLHFLNPMMSLPYALYSLFINVCTCWSRMARFRKKNGACLKQSRSFSWSFTSF